MSHEAPTDCPLCQEPARVRIASEGRGVVLDAFRCETGHNERDLTPDMETTVVEETLDYFRDMEALR